MPRIPSRTVLLLCLTMLSAARPGGVRVASGSPRPTDPFAAEHAAVAATNSDTFNPNPSEIPQSEPTAETDLASLDTLDTLDQPPEPTPLAKPLTDT
ncbi:MAG: hypothetical protein ACK5HA_06375, partial [Planctomycetaceae bacterium]